MLLDELGGEHFGRGSGLLRYRLKEILDTVGSGRTRQHAVHGDGRARGELRQAARHRELRRLRHAVMDHLLGNMQAGFG